MRSALVTALVARAENPVKSPLRRFLRGLSRDELEFIASFLGACILESVETRPSMSWNSDGVEDHDLKMILLAEYLCRSRIGQTDVPVQRGAPIG